MSQWLQLLGSKHDTLNRRRSKTIAHEKKNEKSTSSCADIRDKKRP